MAQRNRRGQGGLLILIEGFEPYVRYRRYALHELAGSQHKSKRQLNTLPITPSCGRSLVLSTSPQTFSCIDIEYKGCCYLPTADLIDRIGHEKKQ